MTYSFMALGDLFEDIGYGYLSYSSSVFNLAICFFFFFFTPVDVQCVINLIQCY